MLERKESILMKKSEMFAVRIIRMYKYLKDVKHENILSKQILRNTAQRHRYRGKYS